MLYVNDFGCQYHAGEESSCTCSIFESKDRPKHPRVYALKTSIEKHRGITPHHNNNVEANKEYIKMILRGTGTPSPNEW